MTSFIGGIDPDELSCRYGMGVVVDPQPNYAVKDTESEVAVVSIFPYIEDDCKVVKQTLVSLGSARIEPGRSVLLETSSWI